MTDTTPDTPDSVPENDEKGAESRHARSLRFSDPEWETVKRAPSECGKNARSSPGTPRWASLAADTAPNRTPFGSDTRK